MLRTMTHIGVGMSVYAYFIQDHIDLLSAKFWSFILFWPLALAAYAHWLLFCILLVVSFWSMAKNAGLRYDELFLKNNILRKHLGFPLKEEDRK